MAQKVDILDSDRWFTNADYAINCYIKQADGLTAQDVSGWTFSWLLKRRATDPDANAVLARTSSSLVRPIAIIDAAIGHVRIPIGAGDTDGTVKSGMYTHELKRTDTGFEVPVIVGLAKLLRSAHLS